MGIYRTTRLLLIKATSETHEKGKNDCWHHTARERANDDGADGPTPVLRLKFKYKNNKHKSRFTENPVRAGQFGFRRLTADR